MSVLSLKAKPINKSKYTQHILYTLIYVYIYLYIIYIYICINIQQDIQHNTNITLDLDIYIKRIVWKNVFDALDYYS